MPSDDAQLTARLQDNARTELPLLRQELQELKRCQLQYFTLSVTGTAAILGFAGSLSNKELLGPSLLAPLAIIIPCWWIFFDKATTITRIVGYVRLIEELLARGPNPDLTYPGYEEALSLFREYEDKVNRGEASPPPAEPAPGRGVRAREWIELLALRTRHRYWMVNFYTFAGLAALCCISGWWFPTSIQPLELLRRWAIGFCALVTFGSIIYSVIIVHQLTFGKRSYGRSAQYWRMALNSKHIAASNSETLSATTADDGNRSHNKHLQRTADAAR
ncbi:MAG TPA: hypothetical protein VLB76_09160 [Thermoanaerobaculia bacterium]|jgi:hypothetical protein|nr:hypothetical protein [Thermoanaerobaculia bacterium]